MKKEKAHAFIFIALAIIVLAMLLVPSLIQKYDIEVTGNTVSEVSIPTSQESRCSIGLKYAPGKFSYTSKCISDSCLSRNLDCTLQIQNLDSVGGVFEIVFYLVDENDKVVEKSAQFSSYVATEDYYEFQNTFADTSAKDKCTYQVVSVPQKRIC